MLKSRLSLLLLGSLITLAACAPADTDANDRDRNDTETVTTETRQTAPRLSDSAAFLSDVEQTNITEIDLAQLALRKTANADIQRLANQLITDHTKASQELLALTASRQLSLNEDLTPDQQAEFDRLQRLSGPDFDREFLRFNLVGHRHSIASFQQRAAADADQGVRSFARQTLPVLKMHLSMAQEALDRLP